MKNVAFFYKIFFVFFAQHVQIFTNFATAFDGVTI